MEEQHQTLIASYGESMLYSHLVEDLLKLNVREAARFKTNGYTAPPKAPQGLKGIIKEFGKEFPDHSKLAAQLQKLREVRNKLTHALVPQVGADLSSEEGRDQIQAMLHSYSTSMQSAYRILQSLYFGIFKQAVKTDFRLLFEGEDIEPISGDVSASDIQKLLEEVGEIK